jgi:hypothetical protein
MDYKNVMEDDFLEFITNNPQLDNIPVPLAFIKLCYFSGYNAAVHQVEKILDEKTAKA